MSFTVKFHLLHRREGIVRDAAPTRNMTVVFLHSRLQRTPPSDWMCVFLLERGPLIPAQVNTGILSYLPGLPYVLESSRVTAWSSTVTPRFSEMAPRSNGCRNCFSGLSRGKKRLNGSSSQRGMR